MPGMKRKPGKGDGSYVKGKPAKAPAEAARVNPTTAAAITRMGSRKYKKK